MNQNLVSRKSGLSTPAPVWLLLVLPSVLILSSCRAPGGNAPLGGPPCPALPPEAYSGVAPMQTPPGIDLPPQQTPVPAYTTAPWQPPGIAAAPWPAGEYLVDGGDRGQPARVMPDWEVRGLDVEDTIAHYDTLDGRRVVEPSNQVCLYSPRFSAVRHVVSVRQNEQMRTSSGIYQPVGPARADEVLGPRSSEQNIQAARQTSRDLANVYRSRRGEGEISDQRGPRAFQQDMFKPYEDLAAIRTGRYNAAEMARLAKGVDAAITWTHNLGVLVVIDHQRAAEEVSDHKAESVFTVDQPPAHPKLRIIKVASTASAAPGETVDFTLRFENTGNQVIGNVTIIDNLTTRLEYVPETATCTSSSDGRPMKANFLTEANEGDSLALRWEIADPMLPGEGGIIRFTCRVR